ncbi:MAG: AAA family ATPase, partial [Flavobacteriaceae bacterium]|nr:AAA family ATPase [Flavobacteriaceae bacterium]
MSKELNKHILSSLSFECTHEQLALIDELIAFCSGASTQEVFILNGYAGTGKTSIVAGLVEKLHVIKKKSVMLAPTGRAAKVLSNFSKEKASTIHRHIYYPKAIGQKLHFTLQKNKHSNTIFFVDEASMIDDQSSVSDGQSLLEDLIHYVFSGKNCRLILIGDPAQLPPVKTTISPALQEDYLTQKYLLHVASFQLKKVMRQADESGILHNATLLRRQLDTEHNEPLQFNLSSFPDLQLLKQPDDIIDAFETAFSPENIENSTVILRSNKRANTYNEQMRKRILYKEERLEKGDLLMVVKNNYFWLKPNSDAGFIANGDIIEIVKVHRFEQLYGFDFAQVNVRMIDYPDMSAFDTILLLNTLNIDAPALSYEDSGKLYTAIEKDYAQLKTKSMRFFAIKNNKHFNALQVKYAYAITCHKAQGGQWDTVFVEKPYAPKGYDDDMLRWMYTAFTRAKKKLYLIG